MPESSPQSIDCKGAGSDRPMRVSPCLNRCTRGGRAREPGPVVRPGCGSTGAAFARRPPKTRQLWQGIGRSIVNQSLPPT